MLDWDEIRGRRQQQNTNNKTSGLDWDAIRGRKTQSIETKKNNTDDLKRIQQKIQNIDIPKTINNTKNKIQESIANSGIINAFKIPSINQTSTQNIKNTQTINKTLPKTTSGNKIVDKYAGDLLINVAQNAIKSANNKDNKGIGAIIVGGIKDAAKDKLKEEISPLSSFGAGLIEAPSKLLAMRLKDNTKAMDNLINSQNQYINDLKTKGKSDIKLNYGTTKEERKETREQIQQNVDKLYSKIAPNQTARQLGNTTTDLLAKIGLTATGVPAPVAFGTVGALDKMADTDDVGEITKSALINAGTGAIFPGMTAKGKELINPVISKFIPIGTSGGAGLVGTILSNAGAGGFSTSTTSFLNKIMNGEKVEKAVDEIPRDVLIGSIATGYFGTRADMQASKNAFIQQANTVTRDLDNIENELNILAKNGASRIEVINKASEGIKLIDSLKQGYTGASNEKINEGVNKLLNQYMQSISKYNNYVSTNNNIGNSTSNLPNIVSNLSNINLNPQNTPIMLPQSQQPQALHQTNDIMPPKIDLNNEGNIITIPQNESVNDNDIISGKQTVYHGSPNANIDKLSVNYSGSNNSKGGEKGVLWFTNNKQLAEDNYSYEKIPTNSMFFEENGNKGKVYESNITMNKPLDLTNLTYEDAVNIANTQVDKGLWTPEQILELSKKPNGQLLKTGLDYKKLKELGYDGVIAKHDQNGNKEYGVFSDEQVKDINTAKISNNIDNNKDLVYNNNEVIENEFRRVQEESRGISSEEQRLYNRGIKKIDDEVRGRLSRVFQRKLETDSRVNSNGNELSLKSNKNTVFEMYDNVNAQTFHDIFEINKKYLKNGELVDLHSADEYATTQKFLSKDGLTGFAITKDGDLISVFNNSDTKGFLSAISPIIKKNVKTLDCYASPKQDLQGMYESKFGFKTASIMDYNMEFDHDNIALNHNSPQIAFMVNTNKNIETKHFNKDQYNDAKEYQLSLIKNKELEKSSSFSLPTKEQLQEFENKKTKKIGGNLVDIAKQDTKLTRQDVRNEIKDTTGLDDYNFDDVKNMNTLKMNFTTPTRVIEKLFNKETATKLKDNFLNPIKHNEAENIRWQNNERNEIKNLGIKPKSAESSAVQKYGEGEVVDVNTGESTKYTLNDLKNEFPDSWEKIKNASEVLRNKYDNYLDKINQVLNENGYDAIPKRKDYFRHFEEITDLFEMVGIPTKADNLPTDINGITDTFAPGKNFFVNALKRTGNKTTYDAITGIDKYLNGAGNLIYHTGDIQRLRTLEKHIRDTYGQEKGIESAKDLSNDEYMSRIKQIQEGHLSEFASWLKEYTNNISGKKSMIDRSAEHLFGRRVYKTLNLLKKQVGSNLIGFNVNSALSNFISATQGFAKTNKIPFIQGTVDTIKNIFKNDGFVDKSDFLTTRFGSDKLSKTLWEKLSEPGQIFMKGTDYFTANQIVRGKYYEYLQKGYNESEAIKKADKFADKLMAGRGLGDMPNAFNSKMLGIVTQFQLETTNQLDSIFYDTFNTDYAKDSKSKFAKNNPKAYNTSVAVFVLGQLFAYAYLFNREKEKVTGNGGAFDPIGTIEKAFKYYSNDELSTKDATTKLVEDIFNQLPFANIISGGGRIPTADSIPNIFDIARGESTVDKELWKFANIIPPTGGSQIRKMAQAGKTLVEGGDYKTNKDGEKILKFPTGFDTMSKEEQIARTLQALTFGKYSLPNAQRYIDNGFKSLSETRTKDYQEALKNGINSKEFYSLIDATKGIESDKDKNGEGIPYSKQFKVKEAINSLNIDLDNKQKEEVYKMFDINEKSLKKYEDIIEDVGKEMYYKAYNATRDIEGKKNFKGETISGSVKKAKIKAINDAIPDLTKKDKKALYGIFDLN